MTEIVYEGRHQCEVPHRCHVTIGAIARCDCGRWWKYSGWSMTGWARMTRWGVRRAARRGLIDLSGEAS